jgi:exo-beta-1,3-glucanase (GH17 family)
MMKNIMNTFLHLLLVVFVISCANKESKQKTILSTKKELTAADILGNPNYQAISFGGYREKTREIQPTIAQLKEDMKLLHAMGIRIIRTYNVQPQLPHASNVVEAIHQLKQEDPTFEMYVMLGAWIDCLNAWTDQQPNHDIESPQNEGEIERAAVLANKYPDIIKVIAVGNEAMIRWATSYYVQPNVILKWVNHLQQLKKENKLANDLWITCSDDFASWGGADASYKTQDLEELINAVDYVSMHTYPYHNSHYNPNFWNTPVEEQILSDTEKIDKAMHRSFEFAKMQYHTVKNYVRSINPSKPIHIGETGWSSSSDGFYGSEGSKASDEYKQSLYYNHMREWTNKEGISCFFFEAFDEPWKDSGNPFGSENHFGIFTVDGKAKHVLWNSVDKKVFENLNRSKKTISKTFNGNKEELMKTVLVPPSY